jgi:flagellar biosynthesis/type III secretory pathway M-ring protein FliF/YscJ
MVTTRTMMMVTAVQDEEHKQTAQETLMMSLGPQVSFFLLLYLIFVLLTNVLGTSYLQGRRNKEAQDRRDEDKKDEDEGEGRDDDMMMDEGEGRDADMMNEEEDEERRTRKKGKDDKERRMRKKGKDNEGPTMKGRGRTREIMAQETLLMSLGPFGWTGG